MDYNNLNEIDSEDTSPVEDIDEDEVEAEDDIDQQSPISIELLSGAQQQQEDESISIHRILSAMAELHNMQSQETGSADGQPAAPASRTSGLTGFTIQDLRRIFDLPAVGGISIRRVDEVGEVDDDDDEVEESDYDEEYWPPDNEPWDRHNHNWYEEVKEPKEEGMSLLMSGEFGRLKHQLDSRARTANIAKLLLNRGEKTRPTYKEDIAADIIPNSSGTAVAEYSSNAYVGQFSSDSAFYYTCVRDFRLHIYDTTAPLTALGTIRQRTRDDYGYGHKTTMKEIKTIQAQPGRWTITDSHLSPDNQRLIYTTISDTIYMATTLDSSPVQHAICFADNARSRSMLDWDPDDFGLWSCKFSADGNEVIAGGRRFIFVYDLLADKRTVKIEAHGDDVNSCCWADTASGNILVSASDDTFLKVWDRRSLGASPKPSGVLIGHTEGITHVSAKGDGRYVISNGKDQVLRLWDLRKMRSSLDLEQAVRRPYRILNFDYRSGAYPKPRCKAHPMDCSVMQYTGHEVLRTLIRCHFSPMETTGQQYIYSGASDGRIHIWSLDGRVVQVLDRTKALPMPFDPSGPDPPDIPQNPRAAKVCVRDVSWHSQQPILMSAGWLGTRWSSREGSIIARHEWKGLSKIRGGLEDYVEKQRQERQERAFRRSTRAAPMPGGYSFASDEEDLEY